SLRRLEIARDRTTGGISGVHDRPAVSERMGVRDVDVVREPERLGCTIGELYREGPFRGIDCRDSPFVVGRALEPQPIALVRRRLDALDRVVDDDRSAWRQALERCRTLVDLPALWSVDEVVDAVRCFLENGMNIRIELFDAALRRKRTGEPRNRH